MTRKLRKATIGTLMALAILLTSFAVVDVNAQAADSSVDVVADLSVDENTRASSPYWGASYLNPGASSVTVYVDVTGGAGNATLKSWDFSSNVSMTVDVYSPSGAILDSTIFGSNDELAGNLNTVCYETGRYKLVFTVISGNSGGWVGAWLY